MSDPLEKALLNLSRADLDAYRREVTEFQFEQQRRHALAMRERYEMEQAALQMQRFMAQPPPSFQPRSVFAQLPSMPPVEQKPNIDSVKLDALKATEPYRVTDRMPDLMEVITAWRAWGVSSVKGQWQLKALGQNHAWKARRQMTAKCTNAKHPAPDWDCKCGIWAFKDLDKLVSALGGYNNIRVLGNVSLWGRVIETENGYRAQYAYPSELWIFSKDLEELGRIYDVPVRCTD